MQAAMSADFGEWGKPLYDYKKIDWLFQLKCGNIVGYKVFNLCILNKLFKTMFT